MKKDIKFPKVEGVQVAIARNKDTLGDYEWYVYLLNSNNFPLENVLVASKGYGKKDGEAQKTSTLRHLIGTVQAQGYEKIEKIQPEVFHLYSQYWVSYYIGREIYDKKFIFVPDSIIEENMSKIDMLELEGVLHS